MHIIGGTSLVVKSGPVVVVGTLHREVFYEAL